jgi:hypothetical protein
MRWRLLTGTMMAIGNIAVAYASDAVPDLNVERFCNYAADRNRVDPEERKALISGCKRKEEAAVALVDQNWRFVPADIQRQCLEIATDSYSRLNRCLDDALDAEPSIPHTELSESGRTTRRFWTVGECLRQRPAGAVCIAR